MVVIGIPRCKIVENFMITCWIVGELTNPADPLISACALLCTWLVDTSSGRAPLRDVELISATEPTMVSYELLFFAVVEFKLGYLKAEARVNRISGLLSS